MTSRLRDLEEAEQRYDGPIPAGYRAGIRYSSPLTSRITQEMQEVEFYKGMLLRAVKAAKGWRQRGNPAMVEMNRTSARAYLQAWRHRRRCLNELLNLDKGVRR